MTSWSFFCVWVSSPDSERTVVLQRRLASMPSPNCCGAWCLPGHSRGAQQWGLVFHLPGAMVSILAISMKFHRCCSGRAGSVTNVALQWFSRNAQSLWLVFGIFIGCALPAWFIVHLVRGTRTLLLWNLISFFFSSVLLRQTYSTINLQTNTTAVLVPVFQYPETLWKTEQRSLGFCRGLGFL